MSCSVINYYFYIVCFYIVCLLIILNSITLRQVWVNAWDETFSLISFSAFIKLIELS